MRVNKRLYRAAQKVEIICFAIICILGMGAREFSIWLWLAVGVDMIPLILSCMIQKIYEDEHECYPVDFTERRRANGPERTNRKAQ